MKKDDNYGFFDETDIVATTLHRLLKLNKNNIPREHRYDKSLGDHEKNIMKLNVRKIGQLVD